MTLSIRSPQERALLEEFASCTREAKALRCAQALLGLDQGERRCGGHTLRRDAPDRLSLGQTLPRTTPALGERLADGLRRGRPPTVKARLDPVLEAVLPQDPRALGSRSTVWTAPLLTPYLRDAHDRTVSRQRVS